MKEYPPDERVLATVLADKAASDPDRPFLLSDDPVTLGQLVDRVARVAGGLRKLGVNRGDPVLLMAPNSVDMIVAIYAIAWLGAVEVPVNTIYHGAILEHIVADSTARAAIVAAELLDQFDTSPSSSQVDRLVVIGEAARSGATPWADLLDAETVPHTDAAPSDLVAVMYTSGTTGLSKGVMVTNHHAYQYAHPRGAKTMVAGEVVYLTLPLFHVGGQWAALLATLLADGQVVLREKFSVSEFWDDVDRWRVTQTILLGVMANWLYSQPTRPDDATHTLRRVTMGPVIAEAWEFIERFGVRIVGAYGSTEVGCVTAPATADGPIDDPWSCGFVRDLYDVRLVDDDGHDVGHGEVGEMLVRPNVDDVIMSGYWRNPAATVAAWRNLWFHTGDLLVRRENGSYRFVDRRADAIRRRGENISAAEIEREVQLVPGVAECAAVAVRSEVSEDEIKLCVSFADGTAVDASDIITHLEARLPSFMVPRFVEVMAELPKTPTGKVQKAALRDAGSADAWDRDNEQGSTA